MATLERLQGLHGKVRLRPVTLHRLKVSMEKIIVLLFGEAVHICMYWRYSTAEKDQGSPNNKILAKIKNKCFAYFSELVK